MNCSANGKRVRVVRVNEDFQQAILDHAKTVVERAGKATNEESTKQFLILPFFELLGYDTRDPDEVFPERDASFSDKFKNRCDYSIYLNGQPVIAVEAKKVGSLSESTRGELKGYYNAVPSVKLGILTDGLTYQLYSDTNRPNMMDDEPYAVIDFAQIAEEQLTKDVLDALTNLRKGIFDPEGVGAEAKRKIYVAAYIEALENIFKEPSREIVRAMMDLIEVEGQKTAPLIREHTELLKEAMSTFFDKKLLERVGFADRQDLVRVPAPSPTTPESVAQDAKDVPIESQDTGTGIVTTDAELLVFDYVRRRLPFLIERDEALYQKLQHISCRDYKSVFTVFYKRERKGRLFNFQEVASGYKFEFPVSETEITTQNFSDIDEELLKAFTQRVEALG